jgi:hypothetical protein
MRTRLGLAAAAGLLALPAPARAVPLPVPVHVYRISTCVAVDGDAFDAWFDGPVPCPEPEPLNGLLAPVQCNATDLRDTTATVDIGENCTVVTRGYYDFAACETGTVGHQFFVYGPGAASVEIDFGSTVVEGQGVLTAGVGGVDSTGTPFFGLGSGSLHVTWVGPPCVMHSVLRLTADVTVAEGV